MSKILFLDSVSGIAGDMFAASFIDAGLVTLEEFAELPALVGLEGVSLSASPVTRAATRATHLQVHFDSKKAEGLPPQVNTENDDFDLGSIHLAHLHRAGEASHTHYADLDRRLLSSGLKPAVAEMARRIFRNLAEAEAKAHGVTLSEVTFHEVGSVDSIMDVVMAAYGICKLGVTQVHASPVKVGRGLVKMAHGTHTIPPPASANLLIGLSIDAIPEAISERNIELSTPTGLAIIKTLAPYFRDAIPPGKLLAQGLGAGTKDLGSYPNVFRLILVESADSDETILPYDRDQVVELACNIDDDTAERMAWQAERLLSMGALDVWIMPVTGKKGRPTFMLSVLSKTDGWRSFADWLLRNSSTFGLRYQIWDRLKLIPKFEKRFTTQGPLTHKLGLTTTGEILKGKAEFEELRKTWDHPPTLT